MFDFNLEKTQYLVVSTLHNMLFCIGPRARARARVHLYNIVYNTKIKKC